MRMLLVTVCAGVLALSAAVGAQAQLAPHHQGPPSPANRATTEAGIALAKSQYPAALAASDQAVQIAPNDPWAHYDRGSALRGLGRTQEAVAEFKRAQVLFADHDPWGRSLAMWGEADTYDVAGDCAQAANAYEVYAGYVDRADPAAAQLARRYATGCVPKR
jgi:Flp pilus assembly protein TadD